MSSNAVKRIINKDMKELKKMDLESLGIYIEFDEDNILNAKSIIIGPENTPYENGILNFIIEFPKDYPFSPPKISYISRSRNRIHPNLYVGRSKDNYYGKVCLSIINTWSGPKWTTVMHIGSVLLSIQSLLNENPLHNEPGFENEISERVDNYTKIIEHENFTIAINKMIEEPPLGFECFNTITQKYFIDNFEKIINKIDELKKNDNKIITSNFYNLKIKLNYKNTKKILEKLYKKLTI